MYYSTEWWSCLPNPYCGPWRMTPVISHGWSVSRYHWIMPDVTLMKLVIQGDIHEHVAPFKLSPHNCTLIFVSGFRKNMF
jgi:hypothetical protein